ncbi:MAG: M6 family metalloprotease domain-containing protein [Prevotellaceae bacterium]|nr:M6 family metalloprotease domain-containing protein [Candidatus Minthosoma caballi]
MRYFCLAFFLFLINLAATAVPAKRVAVQLPQPDGTTITAFLCGDENCHFYITEEGDMLIQDENGFYRKALDSEVDSVKTLWTKKLQIRNSRRIERLAANKRNANSKARKAFGEPSIIIGKKKGLVILVDFKDKTFKAANNLTEFSNQFNKKGYSNNGHIGSVRDYFYDQSYGKLDIEFDIIGPVTMSKEASYYGQNNKDGDDKYPGELVAEACKLADKKGINFKDYDWDGDLEVEQVFIIYAGYGEHWSGVKNDLWPHEFTLKDEHDYYGDGAGPITIDGVKIDTYAMSCELRGASGSNINGIGTACHEFSHCLGIPDFYDTSYEGGFGMVQWDIMDQGSYNGPNGYGEVPAGFTAYERYFAGWLNFTELSKPCTITDMPALQDEPIAYAIYNDGNRNEYFILENRQNNRWFKYISGTDKTSTNIHGMLIYHVDYDPFAWKENEPNNDSKHQRMSIIPADGNYGTYYSAYGIYQPTISQLSGDIFPGSKNITTLNNTSHLSTGGKLFNKNTDGTYYMNKPISSIAESSGFISFKFMGGGTDTAIEEISTNVHNEASAPEYFTLSGEKIDKPQQRGIYIMRQNNITKKIIK